MEKIVLFLIAFISISRISDLSSQGNNIEIKSGEVYVIESTPTVPLAEFSKKEKKKYKKFTELFQ